MAKVYDLLEQALKRGAVDVKFLSSYPGVVVPPVAVTNPVLRFGLRVDAAPALSREALGGVLRFSGLSQVVRIPRIAITSWRRV